MHGFRFNSCDQHETGLLSAIDLADHCDKPLPGMALRRSFATDSLLNAGSFEMDPVAIILRGAIGLQHVLSDGRRSISTIFLPGEILDFRHIRINDGVVISLTLVELCLFGAVDFDRLLLKNPRVRAAVTASHFRNFGFVASHCVDLARKSAIEKLASFIFECRNRQAERRDEVIHLLLKRIDIADYMGLRPETLSRAFAKLKQRKLISSDGVDQIQILNEPALRQIANGAAMDFGCVA